MNSCTHTASWHKEMKPCTACGAEYNDEESETIGRKSKQAFTDEQLVYIEKMKKEAEVEADNE